MTKVLAMMVAYSACLLCGCVHSPNSTTIDDGRFGRVFGQTMAEPTEVTVDFQEMGEEARDLSLRVNGVLVYERKGVTTDPVLGVADSVKFTTKSRMIFCVFSCGGVTESAFFDLSEGTRIGVSIKKKALIFLQTKGFFIYS